MGFSLSKAWKSVKGAVKDAGHDAGKFHRKLGRDIDDKIIGTMFGKKIVDQLTGKTAMKAQQAQANAEAAQAEQQAKQIAAENQVAAVAATNSAGAAEARQRMVNQEAIAAAGQPVGTVDIDIEEGALADPQRRRRYTPGSGLPLTI